MGFHDWKVRSCSKSCFLFFVIWNHLPTANYAATCSGPVESQGKSFVMSPNYPSSYPVVVNCSWTFVGNGSVTWKVQVPCASLRASHRLVASFNESSGARRCLELAARKETVIPAARFRLFLEVEDVPLSGRPGAFARSNKHSRPPFLFTAVAWKVAQKSPKEENASKSTRPPSAGPPATPPPRPPQCDHAVLINQTTPLRTNEACLSSRWRIKLAPPIRVLKIISIASDLKDFAIVAQHFSRPICSSAGTRCPKVTFVFEAVVLRLNRTAAGSAEVPVNLVPDASLRCASLNRKSDDVGDFQPRRESYEVGDEVAFICPAGFSLKERQRFKRKCTVRPGGETGWTDASRPTCFANCNARFPRMPGKTKVKFQCAEEKREVEERPPFVKNQSCAWIISVNATDWILFEVTRWRGPAYNNTLVIEPLGGQEPLATALDGSMVQQQRLCRSGGCHLVCHSARCSVKFYQKEDCALEMTYESVQRKKPRKPAVAATKAASSGTVTASVIIPMLLVALGIVVGIFLIRRSLRRKPNTSPFRHFVPKFDRHPKSGDSDAEIDISKPNFPPPRRKSFGRHSLRNFSARLSHRLRRGSASIGRRLSMSLSGSTRVFFRSGSAPNAPTAEEIAAIATVAKGVSNPALNIQEQHIQE